MDREQIEPLLILLGDRAGDGHLLALEGTHELLVAHVACNKERERERV